VSEEYVVDQTGLHEEDDARPELPRADFDFLVYSLRLQTEMSLGLLPLNSQAKPDLEAASHNIDLLAMLQDKTRGNLTDDERRSLDYSLTELRFRFVQVKDRLPKA
jgi:hypothetical protein